MAQNTEYVENIRFLVVSCLLKNSLRLQTTDLERASDETENATSVPRWRALCLGHVSRHVPPASNVGLRDCCL